MDNAKDGAVPPSRRKVKVETLPKEKGGTQRLKPVDFEKLFQEKRKTPYERPSRPCARAGRGVID